MIDSGWLMIVSGDLQQQPRRPCRQHQDPGRRSSLPCGWFRHRVRPPGRYCPDRASLPVWSAGGRCHAGADRWRAHPAHIERPSAANPPGWPAGCAVPPHPTGNRLSAAESGSPARSLTKKPSRLSISLRMRSAIKRSRALRENCHLPGSGSIPGCVLPAMR